MIKYKEKSQSTNLFHYIVFSERLFSTVNCWKLSNAEGKFHILLNRIETKWNLIKVFDFGVDCFYHIMVHLCHKIIEKMTFS